MKKFLLLVGLTLALILAATLRFRVTAPASDLHEAPARRVSHQDRSQTPVLPSDPTSNRLLPEGPVLSASGLQSKFALSDLQMLQLTEMLDSYHGQLIEEKGNAAVVRVLGPTQIAVSIPCLTLDPELQEKALLSSLTLITGAATAEKIVADREGRETLLLWMRYEYIATNEEMVFTKTADAIPEIVEPAHFTVRIARTTETGEPYPRGPSTITDFKYTDAGMPGNISWTAMAKAPLGFFRPEKIEGPSSRPPASFIKVYDVKQQDVKFIPVEETQ